MHIELLWLIPVIAIAIFGFFIALSAQRSAEHLARGSDLSREVELFNVGHEQQKLVTAKSADERLHEMERTINFVAEAVVNQQRLLSGFQKEKALSGEDSAGEACELREKLRSVFKEYDIILSENYTLRAKIKQLMQRTAAQGQAQSAVEAPALDSILTSRTRAGSSRPTLHLYDDTRLINLAEMDGDDMSESDDALAR
jgi:hypothetical protein